MKKLLAYAFIGFQMFIASQGTGLSLSDFGNPLDLPKYGKWKSDMESQINTTFNLMVPENERRRWRMLNDKATIGDINDYAKASWIPSNDKAGDWSEKVVCYFEFLPNQKQTGKPEYQNIRDYVEWYKNDPVGKDKFKFDIKNIQTNGNDAIIELERYELGVSGLIKQSSQLKIIERWILSGNWLIGLKYEMDPSVDAEKGAAWEQLRSTWLERFSRVHFGS